MKNKMYMIYKSVIEKRLAHKQKQLCEIEGKINSEGVVTPIEKRKYIELKAVIQELENVLDIATSIFENEQDNENA
jgi:hypothetical protein